MGKEKKKKFISQEKVVLEIVLKVVFVLYLSLRELRAKLGSENFPDIR